MANDVSGKNCNKLNCHDYNHVDNYLEFRKLEFFLIFLTLLLFVDHKADVFSIFVTVRG